MKRPWLTWVLFGGLLAVFAGERVFEGVPLLRPALLLFGTAAALTAAGWRIAIWRSSEGESRPVEAVFALAGTGCVVALAGFVFGTDAGVHWLNLEFDAIREELRFKRFFLVSSSILMAGSLLPAAAARWALRKGGSEGSLRVDTIRVRETAANALNLALAGAALMLIGYVASARNRTVDFSYFKTSSPGEAVQEIVRNLGGPLRVALFFPSVSPVKDEVLTYLQALKRATGNVTIEEYDRFADPEAAAEYEARSDGSVFFRVGNRKERIGFPEELNAARSRLRVLDGQVQQALLLLAREERVAYWTTGHGELNDPLSGSALEEEEARSSEPWLPSDGPRRLDSPRLAALRQMLELLNYEVRDIGLREGLGDRIPDDAAMVMILGPERPFLEPEASAVRDYLDRGGSLLLALESGSDFRPDDFRGRLGIDYDPTMTVDDQRHLRERGTVADRRLIVTNRFSTHPSVTTASRQGAGVLLIGAGTVRAAEDVEGLRTSVVVRSMPSSFADRNGNFLFDEDDETRESRGLAVAIETEPSVSGDEEAADAAQEAGADPSQEGGNGPPGMRALVYGDAEIFSDRVLTSLGLNAALAADGIRWLGKEEAYAGEVVSEEDVPIVHTRSQDVAWFYAIIFGAPALVLGVGIVVLYGRRTRGRGAA